MFSSSLSCHFFNININSINHFISITLKASLLRQHCSSNPPFGKPYVSTIKLFFLEKVELSNFISFSANGFCDINSNADKLFKIDNSTFSKKKSLIVETYGFPKGGFEEQCCLNKEAFNVIEIK